jgi:hypothetical protein
MFDYAANKQFQGEFLLRIKPAKHSDVRLISGVTSPNMYVCVYIYIYKLYAYIYIHIHKSPRLSHGSLMGQKPSQG